MNYFKDLYHICVKIPYSSSTLKNLKSLLKSVYSKNLCSLEVLGLNFKDKNQEIVYFLDCSENENKAHPKARLPLFTPKILCYLSMVYVNYFEVVKSNEVLRNFMLVYYTLYLYL